MEDISHINQLLGSFLPLDLLATFRDEEALDVAKSVAPAISGLLSNATSSVVDALFRPPSSQCVNLSRAENKK
jgi:hypothetical protein